VRYEKKYTFSAEFLDEIRGSLRHSPFVFDDAFSKRRVNTLYLDTIGLENYRDNLDGVSNRSKVRLRWYTEKGKSYCNESINFRLEVKLRKNFMGEKIVHKMDLPNDILRGSSINLINYLIKNSPNHFKPFLTPCSLASLGVCYDREYYQSRSIDLRCTIDSDLKFWDPMDGWLTLNSEFNQASYPMEYGIMEMKFGPEIYDLISNTPDPLLQKVSSGRHSKYAIGLGIIHR
tara:strand:+ start:1346 stop:2041 length:696 start_codon:yes stop_codon:yes gene_type:complete